MLAIFALRLFCSGMEKYYDKYLVFEKRPATSIEICIAKMPVSLMTSVVYLDLKK